MTEIPAWWVALTGLAAAWAVFSVRAMPLSVRIALAAPRLAFFLIYSLYALYDTDIEHRAVITRILLMTLLMTEIIAAPLLNRLQHRQEPPHV